MFIIFLLNCEDKSLHKDVACESPNNPSQIEASPEMFLRTYGDRNNNSGEFVFQSNDNTYIVGGSTYDHELDSQTFWIMKIDEMGDSLWVKTTSDFGVFNTSMEPTSDGGYLIFGNTEDSNDDWDIIVSKIDSEGNNEWIKTFGRNNDSEGAYAALETSDGGYIITGYADDYEQINSYPYSALYTDILIIKLDANGNKLWQKKIRDHETGYAYDIVEDIEGNLIIAGYVRYVIGVWRQNDGYLLKLDSEGNKIWSRWYASEGMSNDGIDVDEKFYALEQTFDGGYIIAGSTNRLGWLLKTNFIGEPEWEYLHNGGGGNNHLTLNSVQPTSDGGVITTGALYNLRYGLYDDTWNDKDGLLIKVNGLGGLQWVKTFGFYSTDTSAFNSGYGIGQDFIHSVKETSDLGFILTGNTNSFDNEPFSLGYAFDVWVIKTNSMGSTVLFNESQK